MEQTDGFFFQTDEDEDSIEELVKGFDISITVPEPSENTATVAEWVRSPMLMLQALSDQLNEVLAFCEPRLYDRVMIQVKPEYLKEHEEIKTPQKGDLIRVLSELTFIRLLLSHTRMLVDLANDVQRTPFSGDTIAQLQQQLYRGNTHEFDQAVTEWKNALQKLANWIRVKQLVNGEQFDSNDASSGRSHENAELAQGLANDPRTEVLRQIIRDHPEWVNGKRDLILEELNSRYLNPTTRRRGIGRNLGLRIIRWIVDGKL